jgi:hypothetical protein
MLIIAGLLKISLVQPMAADGWNVENDPGSDKGLNPPAKSKLSAISFCMVAWSWRQSCI